MEVGPPLGAPLPCVPSWGPLVVPRPTFLATPGARRMAGRRMPRHQMLPRPAPAHRARSARPRERRNPVFAMRSARADSALTGSVATRPAGTSARPAIWQARRVNVISFHRTGNPTIPRSALPVRPRPVGRTDSAMAKAAATSTGRARRATPASVMEKMASRASSPATAMANALSRVPRRPVCPGPAIRPPAVALILARPIPSARLECSAWLAGAGRVSTALSARAAMIVSRPSAWAQARACSACAATSRAAMLVGRATRLDRLAPARPSRPVGKTQRARPLIPPPAATMAFATALARAPCTRKTRCAARPLARALSRIRPGLATARELAGIPESRIAHPSSAPASRAQRSARPTRTARPDTNAR
jgi:hypothetical protein